jgi:hypothetical protein
MQNKSDAIPIKSAVNKENSAEHLKTVKNLEPMCFYRLIEGN